MPIQEPKADEQVFPMQKKGKIPRFILGLYHFPIVIDSFPGSEETEGSDYVGVPSSFSETNEDVDAVFIRSPDDEGMLKCCNLLLCMNNAFVV